MCDIDENLYELETSDGTKFIKNWRGDMVKIILPNGNSLEVSGRAIGEYNEKNKAIHETGIKIVSKGQ